MTGKHVLQKGNSRHSPSNQRHNRLVSTDVAVNYGGTLTCLKYRPINREGVIEFISGDRHMMNILDWLAGWISQLNCWLIIHKLYYYSKGFTFLVTYPSDCVWVILLYYILFTK